MGIEHRSFLAGLRRQIDQHFSLDEIELLCFDLGIDYEHLAGAAKPKKIHELIQMLIRKGRLPALLDLLAEERASVTWPELPADFDPAPDDSLAMDTGQVTNQFQVGDVGAGSTIIGNVGEGASIVGAGATVVGAGGSLNVRSYEFSGTIAGDVNIAGEVHFDLADFPIPAPPPTELPPSIGQFVGREVELNNYRAQLQQAQMVVISGMPGMGKSTLASAVALQVALPENVFWHTFRPGEGIETVVWQLAAFLAHRQQDDLWQTLQRARLTRGTPPPVETLINYLVEMLRGRGYILCLDDIHHIDDDPQLNVFIERARRAVTSQAFQMILTSRRLPKFMAVVKTAFIEGLSVAAVEQLLTQHHVILPGELVARLHDRTQGNPELVMLTLELLKDNSQPDRLIDNLSEVRNVERFILQEIDGRLDDDEPEIMNAVSVLDHLGYRGTRYAISGVLDGRNVRRIVHDLADRFLLVSEISDSGALYGQHAIVREFYYDGLSRKQRQALHRLAGIYYRDEDAQPLRAADHFERAGAIDEAVELAIKDVWSIINQGQSRALRGILERLNDRDLPPATQRQVWLALGEVTSFLGDTAAARRAFEHVLADLEKETRGDLEHNDYVRASFGLGDLLAQSEPELALEWLNKGIAFVDQNPDIDQHVATGLFLKIGTIYMWQGDYEQATAFLEQARERLPDGPSQMRSRVLSTLGAVAIEYKQDASRAAALTEEALESCRALHDHFNMATILSNRGVDRFRMGDWPGAVEDFQEGLRLAIQIGSDKARAMNSFSLGTAFVLMGAHQEALASLENGLQLAEATDQLYLKNVTLLALADLRMRLEEWDLAADLLERAEALTEELEDDYSRPIIQQGWAQIELGRGRPTAAVAPAEKAVSLSREEGNPGELGTSLRILGRVLWGVQDLVGSQNAFEESSRLLADGDPYEAALTSLWWGRTLIEAGQIEAGQSMIRQVQPVFERLRAQHELAEISVVL